MSTYATIGPLAYFALIGKLGAALWTTWVVWRKHGTSV